MSEFLSDEDSAADLIARMPPDEQALYRSFGHLRIEAAFAGRIFVVYQPTGLNALKQHREPNVLTTIRITQFKMDSEYGAIAFMVDEADGKTAFVDHIPRRVFSYDAFISLPPRMQVRWDGRLVNDQVQRSLSFAVLIKTKNRADFYSYGNTYCETPNTFLKLYPNAIGTRTLKM